MTDPLVSIGGLDLWGTEPDTGVRWIIPGNGLDWSDSSDSTLTVTQKPRGDGGWAGQAYRKPRSYTLTGYVTGPSRMAAEAAIERLKSAASINDSVLTVVEESGSKWATVRRSDKVSVKWINDRTAQWNTGLVAQDPRRFGTDVTAQTALPSSSGGLTVPFTVPFTIAATTVTGQVSLTNPGTVNGQVRLRISGPTVGPIVTHVASGRSLVFASSITLGAGEWLDVDAEAQTVLANGQSSRSGWVTSRGWPLFEPGQNTYAFAAASFTSGALLTVTGTPAWE